MKKIRKCEIKGMIPICPYCGEEQRGKIMCCSEAHFIDAYLVGNQILRIDEVEIEFENENNLQLVGE